MDASLVPAMTGTNEARTLSYILSPIDSSPLSHPLNNLETTSESINLVPKLSNFNSKGIAVSVSYMTENNERKNSESTIKNCEITQKNTISSSTFACHSMSIDIEKQKSQTSIVTQSDTRSNDGYCISTKKTNNVQCFRSISSPQLTIKPLTRSKVYRKASLKSSTNKSSLQSDLSNFTIDNFNAVSNVTAMNTANNSKCILSKANKYRKTPEQCPIQSDTCRKAKENDIGIANSKNKWNIEDVHITCNPLSTPYPYSTPCKKTASGTVTESQDEEPKSRSCGSFLPILSLIPQTVIGFQYLSPKMKFSWWRNKIS